MDAKGQLSFPGVKVIQGFSATREVGEEMSVFTKEAKKPPRSFYTAWFCITKAGGYILRDVSPGPFGSRPPIPLPSFLH